MSDNQTNIWRYIEDGFNQKKVYMTKTHSLTVKNTVTISLLIEEMASILHKKCDIFPEVVGIFSGTLAGSFCRASEFSLGGLGSFKTDNTFLYS